MDFDHKYVKESFSVAGLDSDGEIQICMEESGPCESDANVFLTKEEAKELADFIYRALKK